MSKMRRKPPRPPVQLTCDTCGKMFLRVPSRYKAKHNFCSKECSGKAAVAERADHVQILITQSIPVYPEMRPVRGRVYHAEKYKYRTNRAGYVVEVGGKRVCVRVDECREI